MAAFALAGASYAAVNLMDLPADRFPNEWRRVDIAFPTASWKIDTVTKFGINPGNVLSDSIAKKFIAEMVKNGSTGTVYFFPAGTYTFEAPIFIGYNGYKSSWNVTGADVNNVVIAGAGRDATKLLFSDDSITYFKALIWVEKPTGYTARNAEDTLAYSPQAGDSTLTLPSGAAAAVGDLIDLKSDNDTNLMFPPADTSADWFKKYNNPLDSSEGGGYPTAFAESYGQISEVTAVNGSVVTLEPHIGITFKNALKPRISIYDSKHRTENIGIQDLYIEHRMLDTTKYKPLGLNDIFDIALRFVRNGYVKNVESYKTARGHVIVEYSHNVAISNSKFSYAREYGVGGAGYGVCVQNRSSVVSIENNEFEHLRHSVVMKEGANHCVVGYNYNHNWGLLDPLVVDSTGLPIQAEADMSMHGMYSHNNLFEGNVCYNATYADYWGPTGPHVTTFRNRYFGSDDIARGWTNRLPDTARSGINIHDFSQSQNAIANIIPAAGHLFIDTSCHDTYLEGNMVKGLTEWNALSPSSALPPSLYLSSAPEYWTNGLVWPPYGPDVSGSETDVIPAMNNVVTKIASVPGSAGIRSIEKPLLAGGMLRGTYL